MMPRSIKRIIKPGIKRISGLFGYHMDFGFFTKHLPTFLSDPQFKESYNRGCRLLSNTDPGFPWRAHVALWSASAAAKLKGDFIECGVHLGFLSASIMTHLKWNDLKKTYYLIDTFSGPDTTQFNREEIEAGRIREVENLKKLGGYDYNLEKVKANFHGWDRVKFIKGLVPDVLQTLSIETIAFLHIDLNCAYPETQAIRFFWDSIVPGGIILLDDYAFRGYEIQGKEMRLLAKEKNVSILSLPTGQGLIVKPPESGQ
jgi:hypothetical protein